MSIAWKTIDHCPLCLTEKEQRFMGLRVHKDVDESTRVYECRNCGFIYNNPQPNYSSTVFDDTSLVDLTAQNPDHIKSGLGDGDDVLDFIFNRARLQTGAKVLDVGFGIGRFTYPLKEKGFEVHGIEPNKSLYDYAVKNGFIAAENAKNLPFVSASYALESFDFIFLEPLQHFTDPHAAIQKALGWLKPGGFLLLEVKNNRWLYGLAYYYLQKLLFRKKVPFTSAVKDPFIIGEYAPRSFKLYAKNNDLKVRVLRAYACNTFIANKPADRLMRRFMERFLLGAELAVIFQKK